MAVPANNVPPHAPSTLMPTQHAWRVWARKFPLSVHPDDILNPMFWCFVARQLQVGHIIDCQAEDASWRRELVVVRAEEHRAFVRVHSESGNLDPLREAMPAPIGSMATVGVRKVDRPPAAASIAPSDDDGLEVNWGSQAHGFRVFDRVTGQVLSKGHKTRAEAEEAMEMVRRERQAAIDMADA